MQAIDNRLLGCAALGTRSRHLSSQLTEELQAGLATVSDLLSDPDSRWQRQSLDLLTGATDDG